MDKQHPPPLTARVVRATRIESKRIETNPRAFLPIARVLASSTVAPSRALDRSRGCHPAADAARIRAIDFARVPPRRRARPRRPPPACAKKIHLRATPASRVAHAPVREYDTRPRARVGECGARARGRRRLFEKGGDSITGHDRSIASARGLSRSRARGRDRSTHRVKSPHTTWEDSREYPSARARGGDRPPGRIDG